MVSTSNTLPVGSRKISFNMPSQTEDWKEFYIKLCIYVEALNIDVDTSNECKEDEISKDSGQKIGKLFKF